MKRIISVIIFLSFLSGNLVAGYRVMTEREAEEWRVEIKKLPSADFMFDVPRQFYEQSRYSYADEYGFFSYRQVGGTCWFYSLMNMFRYKILKEFAGEPRPRPFPFMLSPNYTYHCFLSNQAQSGRGEDCLKAYGYDISDIPTGYEEWFNLAEAKRVQLFNYIYQCSFYCKESDCKDNVRVFQPCGAGGGITGLEELFKIAGSVKYRYSSREECPCGEHTGEEVCTCSGDKKYDRPLCPCEEGDCNIYPGGGERWLNNEMYGCYNVDERTSDDEKIKFYGNLIKIERMETCQQFCV